MRYYLVLSHCKAVLEIFTFFSRRTLASDLDYKVLRKHAAVLVGGGDRLCHKVLTFLNKCYHQLCVIIRYVLVKLLYLLSYHMIFVRKE